VLYVSFWVSSRLSLYRVEWLEWVDSSRSAAAIRMAARGIGGIARIAPGPLMKDVKSQVPAAVCELPQGSVSVNLIFNRDVPPFDNADLRRAMALSLDR
jgi:ABC-type transport system substrate-binding protein